MAYVDVAGQNIKNVYRKALNEVDNKVTNAIYEEMNAVGAGEFGNGWLAATIWMANYFGKSKDSDWVDANLEAKEKEISNRFYFG